VSADLKQANMLREAARLLNARLHRMAADLGEVERAHHELWLRRGALGPPAASVVLLEPAAVNEILARAGALAEKLE
jgi:hypothetical protein